MKLKLLKLLFIFGFILLLTPQAVFAIEYGGLGGKPANPDPSNPRTKSIFIYTLEPGTSKEDGVLVVNNTSETKTVLVYATDSQKSSDGSFACEQFTDTKEGVGSWIVLQKEELTLEPATNEIVTFTVNIPDNASVGEENGCILIQEKKDSGIESGVSLSFRTGLRVAITIPGEQIRELQINSFEHTLKEDNTSLIKFSIVNNGNVSIDTQVKVQMNSILGVNVFNADNQYPILRDDTAIYNFEIPRPFWGGFFTLSGEIEYDPSSSAEVGKDSSDPKRSDKTQSISVFIFPETRALIIEVLALMTLILLIFIGITRYKKDKLAKRLWTKPYIIKEGEDIESLAKDQRLNWKDIVKYNKLKPPYILKRGEEIFLPISEK